MTLKVLVGIMSSGELTLEEAIGSVVGQVGCNVSIEHVSGLKEAEAHRLLYSKFNESGHRFDLMVKVDADMVIESPFLFKSVYALFSRWSRLASVVVPVWDFLTGRNIMGMHFWRGGVRFSVPENSLWADYVTIINRPDARVVLSNNIQSPVVHFPRGTDTQVVRYVWRRLYKLLAAKADLKSLASIPRMYLRNGDAFRSRSVDALALALGPEKRWEILNAVVHGTPEKALDSALDSHYPIGGADKIVKMLAGERESELRHEMQLMHDAHPESTYTAQVKLPRSPRRAATALLLRPLVSRDFQSSLAAH